MQTVQKKIFTILLNLIITLILILGLFYLLSWYSFSTFPTPLVFWRMLAIWFLINLLISYFLYFKSNNK